MPSRTVTIAAGRPAIQPDHVAGAVLHRLRTDQAARRQVFHQAEKERQVLGRDPLLVKRQEAIAVGGVDQEVGVLDPLGDALVGQQLAEIVIGQEIGQVFR